jgi:hypothetical protein
MRLNADDPSLPYYLLYKGCDLFLAKTTKYNIKLPNGQIGLSP